MFISSVAKIRPSTENESPPSLQIEEDSIKSKETNATHTFSRIYDADSQPYHIYRDAISPLLEDFIAGYNVCILLFGETGSGKSHAFAGNHHGDSVGLFQLIIDELYQEIATLKTNKIRASYDHVDGNEFLDQARPSSTASQHQQLQLPSDEYHQRRRLSQQRTLPLSRSGQRVKDGFIKISMQFCELYNEKIHDLLQPKSTTAKTLEINESEQKGIHIRGITSTPIEDATQGVTLFEEAWARRINVDTEFGPSNIRSSAILTITQTTKGDANTIPHKSKLMLVELPGAEKLASDPNHLQMREGSNLNKSLIHFALVVKSLLDVHHVPNYNKSKLTHLLSDVLGGNCQTLLYVTLKPYETPYLPTILRACNKICKIINYPVTNDIYAQGLIRLYRCQIINLRDKVQNIELSLAKEVANVSHLQSIVDENAKNKRSESRQSDDTSKMEEMKEHIKKLDQENLQLHDQVEKLTGKLDRMQSRYNEVLRAKSVISSQLMKKDEEKNKIYQALIDTRIEVTNLNDQKEIEGSADKKIRINELQNKLTDQTTKADRLDRELRHIKQELNQIKDEREELIDEYRTLKANYLTKEANGRLTEPEKVKIKELQEKDRTLEKRVRQSYEKTIEKMQDEYEEDTRILNQKILSLERELSQIKRDVAPNNSHEKDNHKDNTVIDSSDIDGDSKDYQQTKEWIELKNQQEELLANNHRLKIKLEEAEQEYRQQLAKYADNIAKLSKRLDEENGNQASSATLKNHVDRTVSKLVESYEKQEREAKQHITNLKQQLIRVNDKNRQLHIAYKAAKNSLKQNDLPNDLPQLDEEQYAVSPVPERDENDSFVGPGYYVEESYWNLLKEQIHIFTSTVLTDLEKERATLLSKYTVASEEVEQCHQYIETQLIKYQKEILRLRKLINDSGGNSGSIKDFNETPRPPGYRSNRQVNPHSQKKRNLSPSTTNYDS
ncbi:Chromosome-associated kinesin KIF4 [Trichoplax sp. H2]|nr:Chromosome-associated kinesin KIF4 [Trichoplax sp. H2]|eukprot:RDD39742.1 Chromosome-associated kinesin KIF4 [Trichoplax sp. H2]